LPHKIHALAILEAIKMPPKERKQAKKRWNSSGEEAKLLRDLFRNGDISRDDAPKMIYDKYKEFFHQYDLGVFRTNLYRIRDQVEVEGDPTEQPPGRKFPVVYCTSHYNRSLTCVSLKPVWLLAWSLLRRLYLVASEQHELLVP
jgi:hypothetical protein